MREIRILCYREDRPLKATIAKGCIMNVEANTTETNDNTEELLKKINVLIALLNANPQTGCAVAEAQSSSRFGHGLKGKRDGETNRVLIGCIIAITICFIVCLLVHTFFGVGPCSKWLI